MGNKGEIFGDYAAVDYRDSKSYALGGDDKDEPLKLRLAALLALPSGAWPCAASWIDSAGASFRGSRRTGGRRKTESFERKDCPCRQFPELASNRQASYLLCEVNSSWISTNYGAGSGSWVFGSFLHC